MIIQHYDVTLRRFVDIEVPDAEVERRSFQAHLSHESANTLALAMRLSELEAKIAADERREKRDRAAHVFETLPLPAPVKPGDGFGVSLTPDDAAIFFGLSRVDGSDLPAPGTTQRMPPRQVEIEACSCDEAEKLWTLLGELHGTLVGHPAPSARACAKLIENVAEGYGRAL